MCPWRQRAGNTYVVRKHGPAERAGFLPSLPAWQDSQRLAMVKKISEKITCQFPDLDLSITAHLDMREAIEVLRLY
jgi:hypothetical protein